MAYRPLAHCVAVSLVLLLVCLCGSVHAAATDAEKADTLTFLQSLATNFKLTSWTGSSYCSWSGISCDADDLVTIALPRTGLTGTLPNVTSTDTLIANIDLSNNGGLSGSLPASWAKLGNLKTLDLSVTGLKGFIPDGLNGMSNLTSIKIASTKTCGPLPDWDNLPSLTTIDFSNNNMRGVLSALWSNIHTLQSVSLNGNHFCGCEPDSWKNITVLHNAIAGLPVALSTCGTSNSCSANSYNCDYNGQKIDSKGDASLGVVSTLLAIAGIFAVIAAH